MIVLAVDVPEMPAQSFSDDLSRQKELQKTQKPKRGERAECRIAQVKDKPQEWIKKNLEADQRNVPGRTETGVYLGSLKVHIHEVCWQLTVETTSAMFSRMPFDRGKTGMLMPCLGPSCNKQVYCRRGRMVCEGLVCALFLCSLLLVIG